MLNRRGRKGVLYGLIILIFYGARMTMTTTAAVARDDQGIREINYSNFVDEGHITMPMDEL